MMRTNSQKLLDLGHDIDEALDTYMVDLIVYFDDGSTTGPYRDIVIKEWIVRQLLERAQALNAIRDALKVAEKQTDGE